MSTAVSKIKSDFVNLLLKVSRPLHSCSITLSVIRWEQGVSPLQSYKDVHIAAEKSCCAFHYNTCFPSVCIPDKHGIFVCVFMHGSVSTFCHYAIPPYVFAVAAKHQAAQCFFAMQVR